MRTQANVLRRRSLRREPTDAEARLWYFVRNRRLSGMKFRRQHPLGGYFVDFVCLERRLVVELDGGQHALRQVYDGRRTAVLERLGFRVIRFWNDDVLLRTEGVLDAVLAALVDASHPDAPLTPTLSPLRGERE
jgi:very-short-patch-repair endonuclease